jgi:hypothetical protein
MKLNEWVAIVESKFSAMDSKLQKIEDALEVLVEQSQSKVYTLSDPPPKVNDVKVGDIFENSSGVRVCVLQSGTLHNWYLGGLDGNYLTPYIGSYGYFDLLVYLNTHKYRYKATIAGLTTY